MRHESNIDRTLIDHLEARARRCAEAEHIKNMKPELCSDEPSHSMCPVYGCASNAYDWTCDGVAGYVSTCAAHAASALEDEREAQRQENLSPEERQAEHDADRGDHEYDLARERAL